MSKLKKMSKKRQKEIISEILELTKSAAFFMIDSDIGYNSGPRLLIESALDFVETQMLQDLKGDK